MDLAFLQTFREVARRGSFTAAAGTLGYTQSAVSRQMSALEAELGARLFDRVPRGVRLTEEGACVLGHVDALFDRLEVARRDIAALREVAGGTLRVGAFSTATAVLIPRALAAFGAKHPKVATSVVEASTRRQLSLVESGDLHLAVVSAFPDQPLDRDVFSLEHVLDDPMLIAFPRSHRLATRRRIRLAELADERWVAGDQSADDRILAPASLPLSYRPRVDFLVSGWTAKLGLVAAGLGITVVPSLATEAARGDVALVPIDRGDAPPRSIYAATLRGATSPPSAGAFIAFLKQR
jgi:DNA-binding transcriptional LysR family regulator